MYVMVLSLQATPILPESEEREIRRWSWDLDRSHAKRYTNNVVDLIVGKLTRLPADTQSVLQQLACLGNVAELTALSIVLERVRRNQDGERITSEEEVHTTLWPAVRQELIEGLPGAYRFVHDRVQEAAYSLIPKELRGEAHLRIGRLLAAHTPPEQRQQRVGARQAVVAQSRCDKVKHQGIRSIPRARSD
jgi:predicted ATPase